MNSLIVCPCFVRRIGQFHYFPLGLAYISAVLKQAGFNVHCLNLNFCPDDIERTLAEAIREHDIDVVMTGGLSPHYPEVKAIIDIARKVKPGIIAVAGGGLVSSEPALTYEGLGLDFGVVGEGEITVVELLTRLNEGGSDFSDIHGLVLRRGDRIEMTPKRKEIADLSTIPWPDYDSFGIDKFLDYQTTGDTPYFYGTDAPREFPIISSRSCPYDCTFCFHPIGRTYRQRPLDDFFAEVEHLIAKYNVNMLTIYDELFAVQSRRQRVFDFCERMRKYGLRWIVQLRVDCVDEEILKAMKEAGCYHIVYGLESASNTILRSMQKKTTVEESEVALKLTREVGIGIWANFIFGDLQETEETVYETLEWEKKHPEYQANLIPIEVYPGTLLYREAIRRKMIEDPAGYIARADWGLFNMSKMSDEAYAKIWEYIKQTGEQGRILAEDVVVRKVECEHPSQYKAENMFEVELNCPHCGAYNHYRRVYPFFTGRYGHLFMGCRSCNQRFFVSPHYFDDELMRYENAVRNALSRVGNPANVGLWGAIPVFEKLGHHTSLFRRREFACLFDEEATAEGGLGAAPEGAGQAAYAAQGSLGRRRALTLPVLSGEDDPVLAEYMAQTSRYKRETAEERTLYGTSVVPFDADYIGRELEAVISASGATTEEIYARAPFLRRRRVEVLNLFDDGVEVERFMKAEGRIESFYVSKSREKLDLCN